jgi:hypothetical protein
MDMTELLRLLGLRQAYDAYQRNVGQPVANVAGPFGRGFLGLQQPEYGSEEAYRTGQAVGNMPGPNVPAGAIKMAAQVPGLLDVIQAAKNSPELTGLLGLTAYHGSPYRFSKFDPTKIGSGEGAQAYGYGHYFAEAPGVAKGYRDKLSTNVTVDGAKLQTIPSDSPMATAQNMIVTNIQRGMSPQEAIAATNKYWTDAANEMLGFAKSNPELVGRIEKEVASRMEVANAANSVEPGSFYRDPGSFYTVDIPDEMIGRMLDWDKPLSKQPDVVKRINPQSLGLTYKQLENGNHAFVNSEGKIIGNLQKGGTQESFTKNWNEDVLRGSGSDLYRQLGQGMEGGPKVSSALRQAGIPGIRYLDQGSRGAGEGTSNFVVFPGQEDLIKMLKVE